MLPTSKIDPWINLIYLFVLIPSPLFVNSFLLDPHIRAKLKLRSQKAELRRLTYANLLSAAPVGSPLFLSPIIKKGDFAEAQRLATVQPIPPLLPGIESFSGYITVNENLGSNLFFWMFKSFEGDWKTKPLVIWLQGGPGVTSLYGLLYEIGPFYLNDKVKLVRRKYTWCQKYNLLFIDNPVGAGFSFTKQDAGYPTLELDIATNLYSFIVQFYGMFPELKNNPLYITGESYAGKMIPAFAHYIHLRNQENAGKGLVVPLSAVAIGNGWSDPFYMMEYADYLYQHGFIDFNTRDLFHTYEEEARAAMRAKEWSKAKSVFYDKLFWAMYNVTGLDAPYNYINDVDVLQPDEDFFAKPDVRRLLHVGNHKWQFGSEKVADSMDSAFMQPAKPWIEDILNWEAFPFVSYSGQLDIICAYPLSENLFRNLKWKYADAYLKAKRCKILEGDATVGYFKTVGLFTEILFRNCGHMVPGDQPLVAFKFLDTLIGNRTAGFRCD
nr:PREDICTED: venom serine carboxypeptidase-like [Bemisia tabaci]